MTNTAYGRILENKINVIYRTHYATFGPVPVPHSAELAALWEAWESEQFEEASNGE